jgi:LysM repeat protein
MFSGQIPRPQGKLGVSLEKSLVRPANCMGRWANFTGPAGTFLRFRLYLPALLFFILPVLMACGRIDVDLVDQAASTIDHADRGVGAASEDKESRGLQAIELTRGSEASPRPTLQPTHTPAETTRPVKNQASANTVISSTIQNNSGELQAPVWLFSDSTADGCSTPIDWMVYTVKAGDTLGEIARRFNVTLEDLMAFNCLDDPDILFVAQLLRVPPASGQTSSTLSSILAPIPGWTRYSDPLYKVAFSYPESWQNVSHGMMTKFEGEDGFVQLSAAGAPYDLDTVTRDHAYHELRPYGIAPIIENIKLADGRDARLILPSEGQLDRLSGQAALVTQYGDTVQLGTYRYKFLVLFADVNHIRQIASTIELPPPPDSIKIDYFEVVTEDLPSGGKKLTFTWDSHGATSGMIVSGTADRFAPWWSVEAFGELTVEISGTIFRNPQMSLIVLNDLSGLEERANLQITWPCEHSYFFQPDSNRCPRKAVLETTGAFQPFEHGFMIWLPRPDLENPLIYAFTEAGEVMIYPDTWAPDEPESNPALNPPDGLYQPERGFGKTWRELEWLQDQLGWAAAAESAYQLKYQGEARESIPGVSYLTIPDGRILKIVDFQWSYYIPGEQPENGVGEIP